ncbi:MAG: hypothetical protein HQ579_08040, partial [Candidatus Omnitrophica bacterium]|nr:hypothetical protein [Candidatus Omnitrophota bacterium]
LVSREISTLNILYVIDDKVKATDFISFIKKKANKDCFYIYICPITTNYDLVDQVAQRLSEYGKVKILPFLKEFHKNAFLYKNPFIKFLSDFSKGKDKPFISVRKYFAYPFGKFSLWWFSLVAEKSTLKRQSYHNLAKLITIINFQDNYSIDELYIDIENESLKKCILRNKGNTRTCTRTQPQKNIVASLIGALLKAGGYIVFFLIRKCVLNVLFWNKAVKKRSILRGTKFLFVTNFPFVDKELFKENIFRSKYFDPLQASIERRYRGRVSWIGILQDNTKLNISELKLAAKINEWGYCVFMPEELISFRQIISAIVVFFYIGFKFLLKTPYLMRNFVFDCRKKINIWDIYQEEWIYSFFGSYLMGGLLYHHIFSNALSNIKEDAVILYPAELYAWENAINIAKKQYKSVKTIGIQHTSVPLLLLNYFNFPEDFKSPDVINSFPSPDYLASAGSIPQRVLIDSGWPKEKIFNIGAIRYHGLSRFPQRKIDWNMRKKQVIVALPVPKEEVEEILLLLWRAFRDINVCTFVIKPHPICSIQHIIKSMGFNGANGKFLLDIDSPLEDLLISSRAVIVTGSTASLDGIACQCPVIIPRLSCKVDMNPLTGVNSGFARYVESKDELVDTVKSIVNSEKSPLAFDKCKAFISEYFTICDDKDEYFLRLERELSKK